MRSHAYRPERLLKPLASHLARRDNRIAGLHVYTFNDVERAERWRATRRSHASPATTSSGRRRLG
jgi:hypothetical protein